MSAESDYQTQVAFRAAMEAAGLRFKGLPTMDGRWYRASVDGDKRGKTSARYRGYLDGARPAGFIENFRTGYAAPWKMGAAVPAASAAERAAARRAVANARPAAEARRFLQHEAVANSSALAISRARPAPHDHSYLLKKRCRPYRLVCNHQGRLLVPMHDFNQRIVNVQTIDSSGGKLFQKGGRVQDAHLLLGELQPGALLLIAEGYATAATLHEATGATVAVAFSKGNFQAIAQGYGARFPGLRIVFAGDNDHHLPRRAKPLPNVGKEAAEAAARDVGCMAILPDFDPEQDGTDWNDYAALHGLKAVRDAMLAKVPPPQASTRKPDAAPLAPLRPHYPAPSSTREEACAATARETEAVVSTAATSITIRREWKAIQADIETRHPAKSRERRSALKGARRAMSERHGRDWHQPAQRVFLPAPAGSGKTALAAEAISRHQAGLGNVFYATSDLANAKAVIDKIPGAAVVRGRSALDPDRSDGATMCLRSKTAEMVARAGLSVSQTLCHNSEGKKCPLHEECGYQRQVARLRSGAFPIVAGSREYLVRRGPAPKPDFVVIDENCIPTLVGRVEFGLDRVLPDKMERWRTSGLAPALEFRRIMAAVRDALQDKGGILSGLRSRGITRDRLKEASGYLERVEERDFTGGINPGMDEAQVIERLERHQQSEISAVRKMLSALQLEIDQPRDQAHGVAFHHDKPVCVDGKQERQDRISVHYKKRMAFGDDVPLLVLDASGELELYRRTLGPRLQIADAVRCERNVEVVQIVDRVLPRSSLLGVDKKGNELAVGSKVKATLCRRRIADMANALAAKYGDLLLATNKPVEELLVPYLADTVRTGHFGALRGNNDYENLGAGFVVGREQPPPVGPEDIARALFADDPVPLHLPAVYVKQVRGIRMRDGSAEPVKVDVHPDPRVQMVVELFRERESEQALDRLRLIHNRNPKTIYLASNLPLDVTVNRVVTWQRFVHETTGKLDNGRTGKGRRLFGNRIEEAWRLSGGAMPLSRGDLMRLFGPNGRLFNGLWGSERALRDDLERWRTPEIRASITESAIFPPALVRYRRPGQRCPSVALVAAPMGGHQAALETVIGEPLEIQLADGAALSGGCAIPSEEPDEGAPPSRPESEPPATGDRPPNDRFPPHQPPKPRPPPPREPGPSTAPATPPSSGDSPPPPPPAGPFPQGWWLPSEPGRRRPPAEPQAGAP